VFLALRNVTKRFAGLLAVDHVDLDVAEGEFVCFLGPSGCGKTTLLRLIAGLETLDEGEIGLRGVDLGPTPARKRNFGVVFQSYSLFPNLSVARNIAYGLECRRWPRQRIRARVGEMLALVNLGEAAGKMPHELSGGMQQRVALARALAAEPDMLLLDEPLSALDAKVRETLRREIRELQQRLGITTVMVTHDQNEAMEMADRILVMNRGRIEQVGTAEELYWQPATRFVGEFIGRINVFGSEDWRRILETPAGEVIGIRPEHVRFATPAEAADADTHQGVVSNLTFLGNTVRVAVDAHGQSLEIELHGNLERVLPGDVINFRLPKEHLRRLQAPAE
jgi:iron(III) transport system ATP-binding protein